MKLVIGFSFLSLFTFSTHTLRAQCPGGYTSATINWDYLEYLHNRGGYYGGTNPVSGLPWVPNAAWQTQRFAIGTNNMTISTTIPVGLTGSLFGDITTHTGETGAYGTGADIAFVNVNASASTITLTFENEVQNLQFSVFDIDQEITFAPTATNAGGSAVSITLTKPAGASSAIPLNGNASNTTVSGNTPVANWSTGGGSGTNYALTSNNGTVNVDIAGPVKTVVLTFSNDNNTRDFWLSDITACVADPGFPNNYFSSYVEPFTGQPSYFLANPQNLHVYMVDASTGVAEYIFSDPGSLGATKLNSMAYDPVNKWLYYTLDLATQGPANKTIKKYDFNTETISTVTSDIGSLGIPTFIQGIEFSGAAFYNGSLYLGVEECDGMTFGNNAESVIWKIDFDGSGVPTMATQVFATLGDDGGGTVMHDWGDFVVKDGMIISHATSGSTAANQYIHYNMQTGAATTYAGNAESAGQLGHTTNGDIYRIKNNIALYNNDGSIGSTTAITSTSCSIAWSGNAGDGSDPFKPKCDFGDAPASYDPVALSPAVHQQHCKNATLRLGANWDREWVKNTSVDASGDATDEDGIATVTIMNSDEVPYNHIQPVSVFNNTGADATLAGWLDYDADGVFEASEGVVVTVSASGSLQNINLTWNNITVTNGTPNTFLRIRLVSGTGSMGTSDATGWYSDGEVEDYYVVSSFTLLASNFVELDAKVIDQKKVELDWKTIGANDISGYEIQRAGNQLNWKTIGWEKTSESATDKSYSFIDEDPGTGNLYYRLKWLNTDGAPRYSQTKPVFIETPATLLKIFPNPVSQQASLQYISTVSGKGQMLLRSLDGSVIESRPILLKAGINNIPVNVSSLMPGVYLVELETGMKRFINKIIKVN